jgi:hypothetical protein
LTRSLLEKSSDAHPFSLLAPIVPVSPLILKIDPAKRTSLAPVSVPSRKPGAYNEKSTGTFAPSKPAAGDLALACSRTG